MPIAALGNNRNIFKDNKSRWRSKSLFWELLGIEERLANPPIYTLYDEDIERNGKVYPSLKKLYMQYDHVPGAEYEFAVNHLGGWEHFHLLATNSRRPIMEAIAAWRTELEIKHKAMAIKAMISSARNDGVKGFSAAKYLADKGYAATRGRPSKEEVERERKVAAGISAELEEDIERIGLRLVS